MPSLDKNIKLWDKDYKWNKKGEEWSETWGGSSIQWNAFLYPRLQGFLPSQHILEIGCGFGKWTNFLKQHCTKLTAVDLSEKCISYCKEHFGNDASFHKSDGLHLEMIEDNSMDLIFSFDSLVHADSDVITSYLHQFPRILKKEGIAFIHHSNLGSYPYYKIIEKIPKLPGLFMRLGMGLHWRDTSVSAKLVRNICDNENLTCLSQEVLPWDVRKIYTDCISVIVKSDSSYKKDYSFYKNSRYSEEIKSSKAINKHYPLQNGARDHKG